MNFQELKTPCFIINDNLLKENLNDFKSALNKYFPCNICSYSVKTNSLPYILKTALNNGWFLEVVSVDEYNLAKKAGAKIENIIYNGPAKDKETFLEAILNNAFVNIETKRELDWLKEIKVNDKMNVGIRLNINLEKVNANAVDGGKSRFGFSFENGEFEQALKILKNHGFEKVGVHTHKISKTRSLNSYKNICNYAMDIVQKLNFKLRYFDVGGGFYGLMKNKPSYLDYSKTIHEALNDKIDLNHTPLIIEPGNAISAPCVDYLVSIIDVKKVDNERICTSDGSRTDTDPLFHKQNYDYQIYSSSKEQSEKQTIAGATCMEQDILTVLENQKTLNTGDRILFKSQGAYTMTLSPNFINLQSNVYKLQDNNYSQVRKKWTVNEWVQNNFWE